MSTQPTSRPAGLLTLAGHAEQPLREMIFSGELAPGVRSCADDAARRLGMSAILVREALHSLASRGLVESIARRGFRVRAADRADLAETYQLRMPLDPFATTLAVPRMDASALAAMDAAMDTFERTVRAGDVASYDADHRAFHFSVYDHAGSRWLTDIQAMLWENSQRYQRLSAALRGGAADRVAEHRAIADACRRGTAGEAAGLVHDHLARTEQLVTAELEEHR